MATLVGRLTAAPVDTKAALATFKPVADNAQLAVINARDHTIRLVAPAGSGKTQTLVNRAVTRVRDGAKANRILVLTFDNAAAISLREKLRAGIDSLSLSSTVAADVSGIRISTLNAFGYGILGEFFPAEFRPLTKPPRPRRILRAAKNELRTRFREYHDALPPQLEAGFFLDLFSLLKNNLICPRAFEDQVAAEFVLPLPQAAPLFPNPADSDLVEHAIEAVLWLFRRYEHGLADDGTMDFDDQKLRAFNALEENAEVLRALQHRFDEVIVDEFQDVNRLDFALVRAIAARADLVVTGDDDQAIYGFRGCTPDYIIDLEHHLGRSVCSYELRLNYRCPPNIVAHAERLIQHNRHRIAKRPFAYRTDPSVINVASTFSASLEARSVGAFVRRVLQSNPELKYQDVAVLYRTNAQSLPLQLEFILSDIPYLVREEDNLLMNEVLDRLLGILRLKLALEHGENPSVEDAVRAVLGYFSFVETWQLDRVELVFRRGGEFFDIATSSSFSAALPKSGNSRFVESIREIVRSQALLETLDLIRKRWKGMRGMVGSLEDVVSHKASLAEIYEIAAEFDGNTSEFVTTLERAMARARQSNAGYDEAGVALLTYFRAKGRQWHTVVLTTCNEGLIPHSRASVEDERRLFYVALTRASSNLLISYLKDACGTRVTPSRFLEEAGLLGLSTAPSSTGEATRPQPWYAPQVNSSPTVQQAPSEDSNQPESEPSNGRWYEKRRLTSQA